MKAASSQWSLFEAWNRFWFTPADPTLLALMRIGCGLITLYILFIYSFKLDEFMGKHAWYDLETRSKVVHDKPVVLPPLSGARPPVTDQWTPAQREYTAAFFRTFNFELWMYDLTPPTREKDRIYLEKYAAKFRQPPPPPYPQTAEEEQEYDDYMTYYGVDKRRVYSTGSPVWSAWFHVTDPSSMSLLHGAIVAVALLFTFGFATRVTSFLTWMASLWYIHRDTMVLFGVDTMMAIILFYLMIGPSGAALSIDRLLSHWWKENKLSIVNRWRAWRKLPALEMDQIRAAAYSPRPEFSVSANFSYRALQIHLCIIYMMSGLSKLQGRSWWDGTALWRTFANFEFAPMQVGFYNDCLRFLGSYDWLFYTVLTIGAFFTLAFEISYSFLVWRRSTRWIILASAIAMHGGIALFMGLKTFSMMMLVFNMVFLTPEEVHKVLGFFQSGTDAKPSHAPSRAKAAPVAHV